MTPTSPPPMAAYDVRTTTSPPTNSLAGRRLVGAALGAVLTPLGLAALGVGLTQYRNRLVRTLSDEIITTGFAWIAFGALAITAVFFAGRLLSATTTAAAAVVSLIPALVFFVDPFWAYRNLPDDLFGERFAAQYVFETGTALVVGLAAVGATLGALVRQTPRTAPVPAFTIGASPPPPPPPPF
jgi:hypothetical protein